eukprot:jgi/Mesen1/7002/ME000365S06145
MVVLSPKDGFFFLDKRRMAQLQGQLPVAIVCVVALCGLSFYMGGAFCGVDRGTAVVVNDQGGQLSDIAVDNGALQKTGHQAVPTYTFDECSVTSQDATPCTDPERWRKYERQRMAFRERHCPSKAERLQCLIPPPEGYKEPIRWPKSKDQCWYKNVPYDWINNEKANQHWLQKEGDKFIFPGGGTMFPNGVDEYIDRLEDLIPGMKDGSVRTALDTGCGVASWGGALLNRGLITMSLAPRDNHEAQVQFALERGIPAMLGIISTQRLPYPSRAFDLAHCSRCLIPWTEYGGVFLMEIDRVLRPGGFWVLSGPPVNYEMHWKGWESTLEKQKADFDALQDLLGRMCYTQYALKGDFAVWQKPTNDSCYKAREPLTHPPMCDDGVEADAAWYTPMRTCIEPMPEKDKPLAKWPQRLASAPERLRYVTGGSSSDFRQDTQTWKERLGQYKQLLPSLGTDRIRNVMDMNTKYGGLAAALKSDPVWVMNVVSSYATNTLGVSSLSSECMGWCEEVRTSVYTIEAGNASLGLWGGRCEAFSTYPRTYDLLHADNLFSSESHRCEMKNVMLEMDRILRPKGSVIVRDTRDFLDTAAAIATGMRWTCATHAAEDAGDSDEALLICTKQLWQAGRSE